MKGTKPKQLNMALRVMMHFIPQVPVSLPSFEERPANNFRINQRKGFRRHNPAGSKLARKARELKLGVPNP